MLNLEYLEREPTLAEASEEGGGGGDALDGGSLDDCDTGGSSIESQELTCVLGPLGGALGVGWLLFWEPGL